MSIMRVTLTQYWVIYHVNLNEKTTVVQLLFWTIKLKSLHLQESSKIFHHS